MQENNSKIDNTPEEEEGASINLKDFFLQCLSKWYWFAISVVVCCSLGAWYVMKTAPSYERSALIQIRDDNHGAPMNYDFANAFADMGMFSSSADVFNELVAIKSPRLLTRVIDNLDLNNAYTTKSGLKTVPVYGKQLPFVAEFIDADNTGMSMNICIVEGDTVATLTDFVTTDLAGNKVESEEVVQFRTAAIDTLVTPLGRVVMKPNATYDAKTTGDRTIKVAFTPTHGVVESLATRISAKLADEKATVIKLSITDASADRAEDILDNLIEVYNQSWVEDRNQIAVATSQFINRRLVRLEDELSDVDSDISSYKSQNLLPDVEEASTLYLQQATKTSDEIMDLNNKLSMARYVHDYLDNPSHATSLMPANSGTGAMAIDNQINEYNKLMIERNNLASSSSENHPRVRQYDVSLGEMRAAVLTAIDNQIVALNTSINNLRRSEANANARIAASPTQAKYLMSVGRQQKVKESLYLYLLQKREENELGQTFAPYNTRILQDATGSRQPISPRKPIIMAVSFLLGMLLPMGILYMREMLNSTVRSRKDVENLSLPFLGEIPQNGKPSKFGRNKDVAQGILVGHGKGDSINEAFRIMRSNFEFMTNGSRDNAKVVMVTSAIQGSGKTFISMNLAASLALKHNRVLLVDMDLRRHSLSNQLVEKSRKGLSAYLSGAIDMESLISHDIDGIDKLDFVSAGAVPPNPAELVGSERLAEFISKMREQYDFIIIDCPPTEAVEDARTISRVADMTLYVVRINNLERSFLPELERMYRDNRYPRMSLVLNGAPTKGAYAYSYGYSYSRK